VRYVIIGNSAAGIAAVEGIRQCDTDNAITIISDEPHPVYSRPLISNLLGGTVNEAQMNYRPADFYDRHGVETMLGVAVTAVHTGERMVSLAGGGSLSYDRLLIATGGTPFIPRLSGSDLEGVFTFTRWEDARAISRYIQLHNVRSALVLGGGLIGLKTTEALMARGISVAVIELADRILSASLDRTASKLAEAILRQAGTEIRTGTTVREIVGKDGRVDHVVLQYGDRMGCDLMVFAIGVRPNISLIPPGSGIEVERGIVVDRWMQTSVPGVYAAGDCTEALDMLLGVRRPIAIWPLAFRQGYVAGCNIAGARKEYEGGFPMNSVEICGVPTISVGLTDPEEDTGEYTVMEHFDREVLAYKRLVLSGNRLVGAVCVGDIERAGIYTGLIRDRADVSPFKEHLLSGKFGLISLPQEYRKHLVVGDGIEV
jgi:NAD(P)H-nitrite reductase large subunit